MKKITMVKNLLRHCQCRRFYISRSHSTHQNALMAIATTWNTQIAPQHLISLQHITIKT